MMVITSPMIQVKEESTEQNAFNRLKTMMLIAMYSIKPLKNVRFVKMDSPLTMTMSVKD